MLWRQGERRRAFCETHWTCYWQTAYLVGRADEQRPSLAFVPHALLPIATQLPNARNAHALPRSFAHLLRYPFGLRVPRRTRAGDVPARLLEVRSRT